MKYTAIIISVLALLGSASLRGQNPVIRPLTQGESAAPVTAVNVALTVEKESVTPGPYARYAQKYLGAMAPLSARTTYRVTGGRLSAAEFTFADPTPAEQEGRVKVNSNVYEPTSFVKFSPDRTSIAEKGAEDMAREAAQTIYTLRKRRFDLVTGEAGEHVYGAGLQAAIEEMARMEEEYVSLFMGKSYTETVTESFSVVPEAGVTNYVVCRFSAEEGLLPGNDLGAAPIVLTVTPDGPAAAVIPADKKTGGLYRVACWADCRLVDGTDEVAHRRLPLFQLGETVTAR